ncbi:hypothetical protein CRG98_042689 [Punica granatum]|uniref:Uncharacterized protein n=1 Tax=Punica granatum TaxID=22663 RepID=A0A2I0HYY0_PUNGR|nr:hypothetical protein CRG98_042689 [Punica granatum]
MAFSGVTTPADHDLMLFTVSKTTTGHAKRKNICFASSCKGRDCCKKDGQVHRAQHHRRVQGITAPYSKGSQSCFRRLVDGPPLQSRNLNTRELLPDFTPRLLQLLESGVRPSPSLGITFQTVQYLIITAFYLSSSLTRSLFYSALSFRGAEVQRWEKDCESFLRGLKIQDEERDRYYYGVSPSH